MAKSSECLITINIIAHAQARKRETMKVGKSFVLTIIVLSSMRLYSATRSSVTANTSSSSSSSAATARQALDWKNPCEFSVDRVLLDEKLSAALPTDFTKDLVAIMTDYVLGWLPDAIFEVNGAIDKAIVLSNDWIAFVSSKWMDPKPSEAILSNFEKMTLFWHSHQQVAIHSFNNLSLCKLPNFSQKRSYPRGIISSGVQWHSVPISLPKENAAIALLEYIPTSTSNARTFPHFAGIVFDELMTGREIGRIAFDPTKRTEDFLDITNINNNKIVTSWKDGSIYIWKLDAGRWLPQIPMTHKFPAYAMCWTKRPAEEGDLAAICYDQAQNTQFLCCWNSDSGKLIDSRQLIFNRLVTKKIFIPQRMLWLPDGTFVLGPSGPQGGVAMVMGIRGSSAVPLQTLLSDMDKKIIGEVAGTYNVILLPDNRVLTISGDAKSDKRSVTVWHYVQYSDTSASNTNSRSKCIIS